jgi:hypothetical protein
MRINSIRYLTLTQTNRSSINAKKINTNTTPAERRGGNGGKSGAATGGGAGGMFWDGFQWIPSGAPDAQKAEAEKRKMKRLYVGNLPNHLGK